MKKSFAISLTVVYLMLSIGVAKSTHFCMGRAKHTAVFSFEAKKCACAKFNPGNQCCDDEHEVVQLKDDQAGSLSLTAPAPDFNFIADVFSTVFIEIESFVSDDRYANFVLPPKIPIYKQVHSFLIYDSIA